MNHFQRHDGELWAESVPLAEIARQVGTPTYVYSRATLTRHYRVLERALPRLGAEPSLIAFSVKACSNIAILALLGRLGAGADVVSGGELQRALRAGIPAERIVFSGVGKDTWELTQALEAGIFAFNLESLAELALLDELAGARGLRAPVSFRINPEVDPGTHPHIATGLRESKFGIPISQAVDAYRLAAGLGHVHIRGIDCHIGSQLTDLAPIAQTLRDVLGVVDALEPLGIAFEVLDVGGGLGIPYDDRVPPHPDAYGALLAEVLAGRRFRLVAEPGRVIAGNAGVLLTRVIRLKDTPSRHFIVVDAGMNDLVRPALYGAYHEVEPVASADAGSVVAPADIVGPVCENTDALARARELPPVDAGDLLVVRSAGAYGFSMSSNYNSRPRAAEVLVDGERFAIIRRRETIDDLMALESVPDWLEP